MEYIDYVTMPFHRRVFHRLTNGFRSLPGNVKKIGQAAGRSMLRLGKRFAVGAANYFRTFKEGDFKTRLSYLVMGSGSFLRGQFIKGFGLLFLQGAFIVRSEERRVG